MSLPCCSRWADCSQPGCCQGRVGAAEAPIWDCSPPLSVVGTNSQAVPTVEVALENNLVRCLRFILVHRRVGRAPTLPMNLDFPPFLGPLQAFPKALPSPPHPIAPLSSSTTNPPGIFLPGQRRTCFVATVAHMLPAASRFSIPHFSTGKTSPGRSAAKHPQFEGCASVSPLLRMFVTPSPALPTAWGHSSLTDGSVASRFTVTLLRALSTARGTS